MHRDASPLPLIPATRRTPAPTQPPANHKVPLTLFDPYSQQMIVHTKRPDLSPVPGGDAAGGTAKALRLLQLVLLSSLAVLVWYLLGLLQITG